MDAFREILEMLGLLNNTVYCSLFLINIINNQILRNGSLMLN